MFCNRYLEGVFVEKHFSFGLANVQRVTESRIKVLYPCLQFASVYLSLVSILGSRKDRTER
jgi:hypothetical protein